MTMLWAFPKPKYTATGVKVDWSQLHDLRHLCQVYNLHAVTCRLTHDEGVVVKAPSHPATSFAPLLSGHVATSNQGLTGSRDLHHMDKPLDRP